MKKINVPEKITSILNSGKIYDPCMPEVMKVQLKCVELKNKFNKTHATPSGLKKRHKLLKTMLGSCPENIYIEPPFNANWGGKNVFIDDVFYANYNLTLVDDARITIGRRVKFAPNVTIVTATHPISPELRLKGMQYNQPVTIGNNVWLGAGVTVLPGVTIGDNSIIGAGALVNHDIPANVIAVGVPARVLRPITEEDFKTYRHGLLIEENIEK